MWKSSILFYSIFAQNILWRSRTTSILFKITATAPNVWNWFCIQIAQFRQVQCGWKWLHHIIAKLTTSIISYIGVNCSWIYMSIYLLSLQGAIKNFLFASKPWITTLTKTDINWNSEHDLYFYFNVLCKY